MRTKRTAEEGRKRDGGQREDSSSGGGGGEGGKRPPVCLSSIEPQPPAPGAVAPSAAASRSA